MVKAELGYSLTSGVATAQDQELYQLIANQQEWLSQEYEWPFLDKHADVSAVAATRYLSLPTTIRFERPVHATVFYNNYFQPLLYGIGPEEYNIVNSELALTRDPIWKWNFYDETQFEVWPIPITTQSIRFVGQRPLTTLKLAGAWNPAALVDVDDLLVTLFVVALKLKRLKSADADVALQRAQQKFNYLRASYPTRTRQVAFGGVSSDRAQRVRPIIAIA